MTLISLPLTHFSQLFLHLQLFFFCLKEPADGCGGETSLVKNSELLSKLDAAFVRKFEEKQVRYVRYFPDKSNKKYLNWQHVYNTDDRAVSSCMFSLHHPPAPFFLYFVVCFV